MRKGLFILLMLVSTVSFSQEKENYKKAISEFELFYNNENYEAIFDMFNYTMKKAMPLAKTEAFFINMNFFIGKITKVDFNEVSDIYHIYKMTFSSEERDMSIFLDKNDKIGGLKVTYHNPKSLKVLERNTTKMILPFNDQWFVFWGGTEKTQNYHVDFKNQEFAYDFMMVKEGVSFKGDPKKNDSYFAFGKEIIAPCDAKVIKVITGIEDNIPGELNSNQLTGNTIVLETSDKEYILFAHLKHQSIVVREGQFIRKGSPLAQCGNSGNTTEPHLHVSLQNTMDMNIATGGKMYFENILVNGQLKRDYLPIKGDLIKNAGR